MSLFRIGKAIFRSVTRGFVKKGKVTASKAHIKGSKTVLIHHGQTTSGCLVYPSRSSHLWSHLTQSSNHGFASKSSKLAVECGSFLKGHRVFRLIRKGQIQGPVFAFLGFVCTDIGVNTSTTEEEKDFQKLFQWMQKGIRSCIQQEINAERTQDENQQSLKLSDYIVGNEKLGDQSANSAVYPALKNNRKLAVKMLFNFHINSNSYAINKAFGKENEVLSINCDQDKESHYVKIPPHPNILPVLHSFVDDVHCFPDARTSYPAAMPARYGGYSRNKTMYLVMPRLDCSVHEYLKTHSPNTKTSVLLLLQLLEGVSYLVDNGVAHRDMKTENLLLDISSSSECPRLVICDFGCCLADKRHGLKLPFVTDETDRGGNVMLMAPEVITAQSGHGVTIDYSKADAWSSGAIAFELFGQRNPFRPGGLNSSCYQDRDLPELERAPVAVRWVVKKLLCSSVRDRLSARDASTILKVFLFTPSHWWKVTRDYQLLTQGKILRWLVTNSSKILNRKMKTGRNDSIESWLKMSFLCQTSVDEVTNALAELRQIDGGTITSNRIMM